MSKVKIEKDENGTGYFISVQDGVKLVQLPVTLGELIQIRDILDDMEV